MPRTPRNPQFPGTRLPNYLKKAHGTAVDKRNGARLELRQAEPAPDLLIATPHDLEGEILDHWHAYVDRSIDEMPEFVENDWFGCWASAVHGYFRAIKFHRREPLSSDYLDVLLDDLNCFADELGIKTPLEALHMTKSPHSPFPC